MVQVADVARNAHPGHDLAVPGKAGVHVQHTYHTKEHANISLCVGLHAYTLYCDPSHCSQTAQLWHRLALPPLTQKLRGSCKAEAMQD